MKVDKIVFLVFGVGRPSSNEFLSHSSPQRAAILIELNEF